MEKIFARFLFSWGYFFFATLLVYALACYAHVKLKNSASTLPFRKLFKLYISSLIGLFVTTDLIYIVFYPQINRFCRLIINEIANCLFQTIEIYVFASIIGLTISHGTKTKLITKLPVIIAFYALANLLLITFSQDLQLLKVAGELMTTLCTFFLFGLSFLYFYNIYQQRIELNYELIFVVFSLFSYCALTLIIFSINRSLSPGQLLLHRLLYTIHYIFLSLICLSIGRYAQKLVA
jgi:hypothetical protein